MNYTRQDVNFNSLDPNSEPMWKLCLEIEKHAGIPNKNKHLAIAVLRSMLYLKHNKGYIAELAYLASTSRRAFFKQRNKDPYYDSGNDSAMDLVRVQAYPPMRIYAGTYTEHLAFHVDGYGGTSNIEASIKKIEENVNEVEAVATGLLALLKRDEHIRNYAMKIKDSKTGCTAERLSEAQVYGAEVITNEGQKPAISFGKLMGEDNLHSKIAIETDNKADAFIAYLKLFSDKAGEKLLFSNNIELVVKPENYKKIIQEAAAEIEDIICVDSAIPRNFDDAMWNQVLEKMFSQAKLTCHKDVAGDVIYNCHFDDVNDAQVYLNYLYASGHDGFNEFKLMTNRKGGSFNLPDQQFVILQSLMRADYQIMQPIPSAPPPANVPKIHKHAPLNLGSIAQNMGVAFVGAGVLFVSGFSLSVILGSFIVGYLAMNHLRRYVDKQACKLTQSIAEENKNTVLKFADQKNAFIAGLDAGSSYKGALDAWKIPQTYTRYFEYAAGKHLAANQNPEMVQELRTKFTLH